MDYEKLYREANKKVAVRFGSNVAKELFPDLYEPKDERIRKEIIRFIFNYPQKLTNRDSWLAWLEEQGEQKPAEWSEIDKANLEDSIYFVKEFIRSNLCDNESRLQNSRTCIEWLASLKDRVQPQPKHEWSEEDEEELKIALNTLEEAGQYSSAKWLKNVCLVPQSHWKPSDEQIKAVKEAACYSSVFSEKTIDNLISLSKDLKKLKG